MHWEHKEILDSVQRLAKSFGRPDLQDDLEGEGYLGWIESASRGNENPATLRMVALRRMREFISLRQGPLSIPSSVNGGVKKNVAAARQDADTAVEETDMTDTTYQALKTALQASSGPVDTEELVYNSNVESTIWVEQVSKVMKEELSERDYEIFGLLFGPQELTLVEVAAIYNISKQRVLQISDRIKEKMKAAQLF